MSLLIRSFLLILLDLIFMKYLNHHPFAKIGVFALLLLPFLYLLNEFSPPLDKVPSGFSSAILAFEFVSNPQELKEVLGPLTAKEISDLDKLNYVDFGFMLLYSSLLYLFIKKCFNLFGQSIIKFFLLLPPIILLGDLLENLELLRLSEFYRLQMTDELLPHIRRLGFFTWIKWSLLALCFSGFSLILYDKGKLAKSISLLFLIPIILLMLYFFRGETIYLDQFATSIFLMFLILVIFCFTFKYDLEVE